MSDYDYEEDANHSPPSARRLRTVYDDEEFEMNSSSWNPDSIFDDIATLRGGKKSGLKPVNIDSVTQQAKDPGKALDSDGNVLNLPKGGWGTVQSVTVVSMFDYPTLEHASIKPSNNKNVALPAGGPPPSGPVKWKKITEEFFSTQQEELFTPATPPRRHQSLLRGRQITSQSPSRAPEGRPEGRPEGGRASDGARRENTGRLKTTPQSSAKPSEEFKYTRMCNFAKTCKRKDCSFAHTLEQFTPVECKFQDRCKTQSTCRFKHSCESKEAFLERTEK